MICLLLKTILIIYSSSHILQFSAGCELKRDTCKYRKQLLPLCCIILYWMCSQKGVRGGHWPASWGKSAYNLATFYEVFTMNFLRLMFLWVVILNDRRLNDFHRNIKHRMTMPSGWVNSKWKLPHMLYRGIIPVPW